MKLRPQLAQLSACFLFCLLTANAAEKPEASKIGEFSILLPPGVKEVSAVEGIHEYRLPNGLRVLLFPDASKATLTVNVTYLVGSQHENYGETGMAHLLEHLMFKGTPSHKNIPQAFKQRAARFNGSTSLDRTNYFESLPATEENLQWALQMEADRMVNSFIARKDLDSEMTVVRNEYEMGENDPTRVLEKRMQSIAFDWHSYGRSTIGNRSDIENVRIENLQGFYRTYYQPDNAVLLVAGKFDPRSAFAMIESSFGKIPKPKRTLPPFWTVEPTQDGERSFYVRRKDDSELVWVAYKVPSELANDHLALDLGEKILGDSPSGRLYQALVKTGKVARVSYDEVTGVAPGLRIYCIELKKGDPVEPARDALIAELESFAKNPPSAQELERSKLSVRKSIQETLDDPEKLGVELSESIALGDWRLFFKDRDDLEKVTATEVSEAAAKYYRRDNRTVGIYLPEAAPQRAEIAQAPSVAEILKDYHPKAESSTGEAFDATPANIQARTRLERLGGLKLAFLPKKNRGETVCVSFAMDMGNAESIFGKSAIEEMTWQMIGKGTNKMSRQEISDTRDRLMISGGITNFQTDRAHLPDALRLMAHLLRDPSFPENEFEQLRKEQITSWMARAQTPSTLANVLLGKHFNHVQRGDWRYHSTVDERIEDLKKVTRDDLVQFHRDFFGASYGRLSIVGDFDPDQARQIIEAELGSWKSSQPYSPLRDEYTEVAPATLLAETPDKENGVIFGCLNLDLKDDSPDYPALMVANHILGGGAMSSRLGDRLRQKDGVSYSVGSALSVHSLDNASSWRVFANAAPQNISKAETGIREELARAVKDGFTAEEVSRAIEGILKGNAQWRSQDSSVAGSWNSDLLLDRSFGDWEKKMDGAIAAVTVDSANAALRKYIDPTKLSLAIGADPAKRK